ncbi:GntR family transcriptional regulator [Streptomyces sp. TRM 70351]|uniref:GntR family transcriptional regulator n=1 Tax=Streptomyces sp. TRM 70351 TaxID=3116552 RepID=UPI002E7B5208|nr:GntR family transcriptional regulator [Streptomyces sp. TRM 70351]MEE1928298.1 GntR family transcriptional regulator [Streptomyces sp. TRM 70351]
MAFAPSPIPSRTQYVLDAIKHGILTGQLVPGQALVEAELAARFGVSKTPVREALKTLAGTGLVVMSQYKGVTVREVDATMAREVYDVRLLLEPEALRRTVGRGAALEAAREALERADTADDQAERSLANRDFHRSLYAPCGNPLLCRMLDEVRDQAALVSAVGWQVVASWEREAAEHREILRLALDGDAAGAARALYDHIASFVRRAYPDEDGPGADLEGTPASGLGNDHIGSNGHRGHDGSGGAR